MNFFDILTLIGGLCLFLFGMNVMGEALERRAGSKLRDILGKMTTNKFSGFLTGCGITAIIQSSSATTVMVVGFVNSGLMTLTQAINVIMGSNVGTTITGWILSLSGVSGDSVWVKLFKPESFVPICALIGIVLYMGFKGTKKMETGTIFLGFATLMFGMETMSEAASGLAELPGFQKMFIMFENPVMGLIAGAALTAVIQSSSASVGILQALALTGQVTFGAAVPIVMGDAIGTCVTAVISSIGAKRDAKRAAYAHLAFNIIGSVIWITVYIIIKNLLDPAILHFPATVLGIAIINTMFKVLSTAVIFPFSDKLELLVRKLVPDTEEEDEIPCIDDRLLATPALALSRCNELALLLAHKAVRALKYSIDIYTDYSEEKAAKIRKDEQLTDRIQDVLETFLIKLSSKSLRSEDSERITALIKAIENYERIGDHAVNILESYEQMVSEHVRFSEASMNEFNVIADAVMEVIDKATVAFEKTDVELAGKVEPLEQVVDQLKDEMMTRHIQRMKDGICSIEAGIIWTDILTDLERTSDHGSNIAGCIIDMSDHNLNIHETIQKRVKDPAFDDMYRYYSEKYRLQAL